MIILLKSQQWVINHYIYDNLVSNNNFHDDCNERTLFLSYLDQRDSRNMSLRRLIDRSHIYCATLFFAEYMIMYTSIEK